MKENMVADIYGVEVGLEIGQVLGHANLMLNH